MQTRWMKVLFGMVGVVVMAALMGCTTVEEEKNKPFLGTEWAWVEVTSLDGSVDKNLNYPDDFISYTFSSSQVTCKEYENGTLQSESPYCNVISVDSEKVVYEWTECDSIYDPHYGGFPPLYKGVATCWYTISGKKMQFTNGMFIGTNVNNPDDIVNKFILFPRSFFLSADLKATGFEAR